MSALVELPITPRRTFGSFFSPSKPTFSNIHPNTISNSMIDENMEKSEAMITKWNVQASTLAKFSSLFHGESRKEANEFITCVKDLRHAMHFLVSEGSRTSVKLVQAQNLMTMSMKRLEREFYQILSSNRAYLDPESVSSRSSPFSGTTPSTSNYETSDYSSDYEIQTVGEDENHDTSEVDRRSAMAMSDLRMIADCMISVGYSKECLTIYKLIRKSIVDEWFYKHGIERYSSSQITKMNATSLEGQMNTWLNAVKVAVRTLLHGERLLCDHVFWSSGAIRESCFTNIAKEGATNLFKFPEFAAKSKRWPEKIFRLMEMHAALSDMLPDIESMFSYESLSSIKTQIFSSLQKLVDSVQTILTEFESSVQKNSSKVIYHGGAIHPLTISVMEYVSKLATYSGTLSGIIGDSTLTAHMPFPESYFSSPVTSENQTSAASNRVAWIILVLLCKLDTKSVYYNDTALTYLFLSNNLLFILQIVQTTALQHLLGDDWMANLERKIKVYATKYELTSWGKVVACLPENLQEEMTTDTAKAYFRQFISTFDEAYQKQKSWVVPDGKFREDIKISIARKLVPAYREFFNRHIQMLKAQRSAELLLRFSPDNLGNYLSDILHGTGDVSESSPSPSPSSTSRALKCLT